MPYTLVKGLVWVLLAVLLGIVIGWLLRSVVARRQVDRVRAGRIDTPELERLRARVANLEAVVDERDRLRRELAAAKAAPPTAAPEAPAAQGFAAAVAEVTPDSEVQEVELVPDSPPAAPDGSAGAGELLDEAAAVLGTRVVADDLTVIEGIGPKIRELCHGIGITTWDELAATEVSLLRTMLNDAGQRFKAHDPGTWPRQAGMLAAGEWAEFKAWTDELHGGRTVE